MKKAQAALEFLMTYGWAILVVLAAIGALAYFGVLSPSKFLPDKCVASTGFGCAGKPVINTSGIYFVIHQGLPNDVTLTASSLSATAAGSACSGVFICSGKGVSCGANVTSLTQDGDYTVALRNCGTYSTDNTVKADLTITYVNPQSNLADSATFSVQGRAK